MKIAPLALTLRGVIVRKEVKTETQHGWRRLWRGKTVKHRLICVWFAFSRRVMWLEITSEGLYNRLKDKQQVSVGVAISAQKFYATTSTAPDSANDVFRAEVQEPKGTMKVTHDDVKPDPMLVDREMESSGAVKPDISDDVEKGL